MTSLTFNPRKKARISKESQSSAYVNVLKVSGKLYNQYDNLLTRAAGSVCLFFFKPKNITMLKQTHLALS